MYQLDNNFSLSLLTCCRYIVYLKSSFSIKNNLYLWQPISRKKVTWFCKRNSNCIFVFFLSASRECDQFELFLRVLYTNFLSKQAQISADLWGHLKIVVIYVKTAVSTFWATFERDWATFFISIRSQCFSGLRNLFVQTKTKK